MPDPNCKHAHKVKQIGVGSDGKTYCAHCGAEVRAYSFMDLVKYESEDDLCRASPHTEQSKDDTK